MSFKVIQGHSFKDFGTNRKLIIWLFNSD